MNILKSNETMMRRGSNKVDGVLSPIGPRYSKPFRSIFSPFFSGSFIVGKCQSYTAL